jgi:signal transduction histidine kinase
MSAVEDNPRPARRRAVTGLLLVCLALGVGLWLLALVNHRAATRAARDVLYSRAAQLAGTFVATARVSRLLLDREQLQQLTQEMAADRTGIAVVTFAGQVLAAAEDGRAVPASEVQVGSVPAILGRLASEGRYAEMERGAGGPRLVFWRGVAGKRGPRAGRGRGWWRRWGGQPQPGGPPKAHGRRGLLLRVTVPADLADPLVDPATNTLAMASTVALTLLLLGGLLYRADGRARRAEAELGRRQALSALGEVAAVLAHEIRTPLASIKGNAQLLAEREPAQQTLQSIVDESARLERLVNGLLDYARPGEPNRVPCDPDELARRAAEIVSGRATALGVDLVLDPGQTGECLEADPDQLIQVLVNLLQNGVEAAAEADTADRAVVLRVKRRGAAKLELAVLDRGPGLGSQPLQLLMRPFFSTKPRGTGLGLAVARQIVEQHGGDLLLEPREGGGAQALVTLPAGRSDGP